MEQVNCQLNVKQDPNNPLNEAVEEEKGGKRGRDQLWMSHTEVSIMYVRILLTGCLLSAPATRYVYFWDGSAQTIARAATLR